MTSRGCACSAYLGILVDETQVAEGGGIHPALDEQLLPHGHRHLQNGCHTVSADQAKHLLKAACSICV